MENILIMLYQDSVVLKLCDLGAATDLTRTTSGESQQIVCHILNLAESLTLFLCVR